MEKNYHWNLQKNQFLKIQRNISFEDVVNILLQGLELDDVVHHNKEKYPRQRAFEIKFEGYYFYVPYVEEKEYVFLKNIIPSRKLKKKYEGKDD